MKRPIFTLALLVAFVFAGTPEPSFAQSTIETRICNDVDGATLTIDSPASDSLVNEPTLTITGAVNQSNQLEIFVDEAFNGVVPLDSSVSKYNTSIQLPTGTHKITVTAIDACQVANASQSVVITYQSAHTASTGSEVPTDIAGGNATIGSPQAVAGHTGSHSPPTIIDRFISPILNNVVDALDLQDPATKGVISPGLTNMNRFLMMTGGLILLLTANPITNAVSGWSLVSGDNISKRLMTTRRATRAAGILLILLVFIL